LVSEDTHESRPGLSVADTSRLSPGGIRFAVAGVSTGRLAIYDATGRNVSELAVRQSVTWDLCDRDGRRVGSGLYFARLEAGSTMLTRRFALLE
jgi:hypothetical protein